MEAAWVEGAVGCLTRGEARAFKRRWEAVNAAEREELILYTGWPTNFTS